MKEKEIKIDHAIELIKCKVCGNITEPSGNMSISCDVEINRYKDNDEFRLFASIELNDGYNSVSLCNECHKVFVKHIKLFEITLKERVGLYKDAVVIKQFVQHIEDIKNDE